MKSNLGPRFKKALPYIIATATLYLLIPPVLILIEFYTANGSGTLFNASPAAICCAALGIGYLYGKKANRDPIMPLMSAALFLLPMFVYYNVTAWIYAIIAAGCSFLGECFGAVNAKTKK